MLQLDVPETRTCLHARRHAVCTGLWTDLWTGLWHVRSLLFRTGSDLRFSPRNVRNAARRRCLHSLTVQQTNENRRVRQ